MGQLIDYEFTGESNGLIYSGKESPFWLHSNKRGRIDEKTHLMGLLSSSAHIYLDEDTYFNIGAGLLYQDGFTDKLQLDEVYAEFISPKFGFTVGRKQKKELFRGLSATNQNILWSLNARPLPGIQIFTTNPIFINGENHGLGFTASLEEYFFDDDRFVKETRLHHKSFHFVYRNKYNLEISLGLQHFVQWAGISPEFGKLPNGFDDYIDVFTGRAGDDPVGGQEVNALGNQLGSVELQVKTKINDLDVQFIYNNIFEDGSGLKGGNLPDGRYTFYVEDNRDTFWGTSWLKAFMYEIYYTKNQSKDRVSSEVDGNDNYFNNNLYRSGWTYESRILGVPFINLKEERFRVGNNKILVHHIGIEGKILDKLPYRFLISYRSNYGAKGADVFPNKNILSTFLELEVLKRNIEMNIQIGSDINSNTNSNFGLGLSLKKSFL